MTVAIDATEQDFFPPRVLVTVTGLTLGDDVQLYRVVAGDRTPLRGGTGTDVIDTSLLVVDAELPFDVPVSWLAVVNDVDEYATTAAAVDLGGDKVVFTDAITGAAAEAVILAWPEKDYDRQSSVFLAGGRNVVVAGPFAGFRGDMQLTFDTYSSGQNFWTLVTGATQAVVQVRRPLAVYDGVDAYLTVLSGRELRFSQDGSDGRRTWSITVAETDPWADDLAAVGTTYADVETYYTGLTYADAAGDFPTYLDAEQADYTP